MCSGSVMLEILGIVLILLLTLMGECAVCGSPLQRQQNVYYEENKCRDAVTNREMYIGEAFHRRGQCIRVQCLWSLDVWEDRCQVPNLEGNCSQIPPANEFLDYPKCCPLYECKLFMNDSGRTEETRIHDHYGNRLSTKITQVFIRHVDNRGATPLAVGCRPGDVWDRNRTQHDDGAEAQWKRF